MFLDYLRDHETFEAAAPRLRRGASAYAPRFYAPYVLAAALADDAGRVVVAPDGEAATRLAADLSVYLDRVVPVLPARGVLYGADVAPAPHVVGERQQALAALAAGGLVVIEAVTLLERFLPLALQPQPLALAPGEEIDFAGAVARLADLGYERIEQVRGRGEFAVRGGLIDAYPALGDPLRIEFWGDEVESLRTFSIYSQRTTGALQTATVFAAFEADVSQPDYVAGLRQAVADWELEGREEAPEELERRAAVRALAALAGRFTTLGDVVGEAGLGWAVFSPDETYRALADFDAEVAMAVPGAGLRERLYVPLGDARAVLAGALHLDVVQRDQPLQFAASRPQFAARDLGSAERDLVRLVNDEYRVFVVFRHEGEAERATYRLRNISAEVVTPEQLARGGEAGPGLYFVAAPLREGFVAESLKLAVVNERALIRAAPRERRFAAGTRLTTFFDVRPGDHVVHEDHGVARFAGIETRTVANVTRDYLLLEFRGDDRVFVPHDQIGKVSRYVGASGATPSLDKLGGTHWQTVKTRARTAVVEMAGELLQLYAARQAIPGFAFPADGELMRRLEDAFPYEETDDQAEAIDEVKNDMEAPHPM
ncbi:MAG TPA: CarD family transcriptional regulator, partial [Thermoleophilia bacterium]|nr:CarD family transcriptional regulator [Thermoleophilia bacterium]